MTQFTLPPLNYPYNALEPFMDEETLHLHHDKHHQKYVDNLNAALAKYPDLFNKSIDELVSHINELPSEIQRAVRNNGGGHFNHSFFWEAITPNKDGQPGSQLKAAIDRDFGSFEAFKNLFKQTAIDTFGSGYTWLVKNSEGTLSVISTANQDTPLEKNLIPLIVIDLWEHAYYLKYQNRRPDYIDAFFNIINWERAEKLYNA